MNYCSHLMTRVIQWTNMRRILFVTLLLCTVFLPCESFAALRLNLDYPTFGGPDINRNSDLPTLIAWLYYVIIALSGLAAFIMIVYGGIKWMTSGVSPSAASDAKDRIKNAILGLSLVLSSFILIRIINPATSGPFNIELESVGTGGDAFFDVLIPQGNVPVEARLGEFGEGAYLCKNINCEGNINQSNGGDAVFAPFNLTGEQSQCTGAFRAGVDRNGEYSDVTKCKSYDTKNWGDKTKAVGIQGNYDIVLYENTDFSGRAICFQYGNPRLESYLTDSGAWGSGNKVRSIKIKSDMADSSFCKIPGLTVLASDLTTEDQPKAFFFNKTNYGGNSGSIIYGAPTAYLYLRSRSVNTQARSLVIKGNNDQNLGDDVAIVVSHGDQKVCFVSSEPDLSLFTFKDNKNVASLSLQFSIVPHDFRKPPEDNNCKSPRQVVKK